MGSFFDNVPGLDTSGFADTPILDVLFGTKSYKNAGKMVATTVKLGDGANQFVFLDTEIPQNLPLGGPQVSTLHEFFGGARAVDVYGAQFRQLNFSGVLMSLDERTVKLASGDATVKAATAKERAQQLLNLWYAGNELKFYIESGKFWFRVIIANCEVELKHENLADYTLSMHILDSNILKFQPNKKRNAANNVSPFTNIFTQLTQIVKKASKVVSLVTGALTAARGVAQNLATNPQAMLYNGVSILPGSALFFQVEASVKSAQASMQSFIDDTHPKTMVDLDAAQPIQTLTNDSIKSNLIPTVKSNEAVAKAILDYLINIAPLISVTDPTIPGQAVQDLYPYKNALTLLIKNLELLIEPDAVRHQTLYNPNLYVLASRYYKDANQWQVIADANQLDKPILSGLYNLKIPVQVDIPVTSKIVAQQ